MILSHLKNAHVRESDDFQKKINHKYINTTEIATYVHSVANRRVK